MRKHCAINTRCNNLIRRRHSHFTSGQIFDCVEREQASVDSDDFARQCPTACRARSRFCREKRKRWRCEQPTCIHTNRALNALTHRAQTAAQFKRCSHINQWTKGAETIVEDHQLWRKSIGIRHRRNVTLMCGASRKRGVFA